MRGTLELQGTACHCRQHVLQQRRQAGLVGMKTAGTDYKHIFSQCISVGTLSVECCSCSWVPCCLSAIQKVQYLCIRDLCRVSLPLHQRAPTANQTDAAAVLRQNGNDQNAHMFNSDDIPALMLANLKNWALPTRSAMLIYMAGVTSLPCTS